MKNTPLHALTRIHKALAHPARLRILAMLRSGELCVCQITAILRLAASTVSAHLAELKRADLVEERKDGRWVHYRVAAEHEAANALAALWPSLEQDPRVREDATLRKRLTRLPVATICSPGFSLAKLGAGRVTSARSRRKERA